MEMTAHVNNDEIGVVGVRLDFGKAERRDPAGTHFSRRPGYIHLDARGATVTHFLGLLALGPDEINSVTASFSAGEVGIEIEESTPIGLSYRGSTTSTGSASLRLAVRRATITKGDSTVIFAFDPAADAAA